MALNMKSLGVISIYALVFSTLYQKATTSRTPASTPSESTSTPTPTPTPTPSHPSSLPAGNPITLSEFIELALPDIGRIQTKESVAPQSEGAKVACKQLEAIEHKITEYKITVVTRLRDPNTPELAKNCLSQCLDNFDDAIIGIQSGIDSINKKDQSKANSDVSGVSTDIMTCNDCFTEVDVKGEDKEVKAFNDWVQGMTRECLVNLKNA